MKIKNIITNLINPHSNNQEKARHEFILNIILAVSIISFVFLNIIRIIDVLTNPHDRGLALVFTLSILLFFIFLFWLSKRGLVTTASLLLIATYAIPTFYSFITWGADLPAALLLTVLLITMSGALIGAHLAFISTVIISLCLLTITYLQENKIIQVASYWRQESHDMGDAIVYTILLFVIATIAWLFSRGIKQALQRARASEKELKIERDSLEIKVIKRTQQIKQMEAEKINQLYRLAEFGRLSSGIFHDLINPLTAVSLNLEQITAHTENQVSNAKACLKRALIATNKMEGLIASIKKQINRKQDAKIFSINEEINETIQILSYKARRANVKIVFEADEKLSIHGDAIKFSQIITNLVSNAIEAYEQKNNKENQQVKINLSKESNSIKIVVIDGGCGIDNENINKIFEPFFSTKNRSDCGMGVGLSSTKNIVEKEFGGSISVHSGSNTVFQIILPTKL